MSAFYIEAANQKFDPTWVEFHKPVFIAGHGYLNSVSVGAVANATDRPCVAGCSKTPDGWLIWMASGAAALVPDNNIRYVAAQKVAAQPQAPSPAPFAHLPAEVRAKIEAQANGGFAGDSALGGLAPAPLARAVPPVALAETAPQSPSSAEGQQGQALTGQQGQPVKKRRGRPPKVRSSEAGPSTP